MYDLLMSFPTAEKLCVILIVIDLMVFVKEGIFLLYSGGLDRLFSRSRCVPRWSHRRLPRNVPNRCCLVSFKFSMLDPLFNLIGKHIWLEPGF